MEDILRFFEKEDTYAGKINQNNISVPLSMAAVGNEEYIDMYNLSQAGGYSIKTGMPGVFDDRFAVGKGEDLHQGQYQKGNIDLNNRPIVDMGDGSFATVRSMSFQPSEGEFAGKQVLVPTISDDGNVWSDEEAIENFNQTGKHLGVFDTIDDANEYAQQLHQDQEKQYKPYWDDQNDFSEGGPTGFATDISSYQMPSYMDEAKSGTDMIAPNTKKRKYSQAEIYEIADHYASMFGIPHTIARNLIRQESGGNPNAISKAGAAGVMQLMPGTAKGLGVKDRFDPAQNIWGGYRYLRMQFDKFKSWPLALSAYNAGPGNVLKYKGIPHITETQNYVKNILAGTPWEINSNAFPIVHDLKSPENQAKFINPDTGMLSTVGMNNFVYIINNSATYKNKVKQIETNRPELLENKPEYSDFKKYREMKTADGKPLFVKGDINGFKVLMKNSDRVDGKLNPVTYSEIAKDMAKNQTSHLPKHLQEASEALLRTFHERYDGNYFKSNKMHTSEKFGLANLTSEEYEKYGVPISCQQNPILQARVLDQEFQRAEDILGSVNKAIYALSGGSLKDEYGKIRTWDEIKKDKENFMKRYFIVPSKDDKIRDAVNKQVETFHNTFRKLRGM